MRRADGRFGTRAVLEKAPNWARAQNTRAAAHIPCEHSSSSSSSLEQGRGVFHLAKRDLVSSSQQTSEVKVPLTNGGRWSTTHLGWTRPLRPAR